MDIGSYKLKEPFRKFISRLLPLFKNTNPNLLSFMIFPISILTVGSYWLAKAHDPIYYLLSIVLIFLRMIFATLDGYVAISFKKESQKGDYLNRLMPEISDITLLGSLLFLYSTHPIVTISVMGVAWLSAYMGIAGLIVKYPISSLGPVGQTDRLIALMIVSLALFFREDLPFMLYFFYWCILGGVLTLLNRYPKKWRS